MASRSAGGAVTSHTRGGAAHRTSAKHAGNWRDSVPEARVVVGIHEASNKREERTAGDARCPWLEVAAAGHSPAR